GTARGFDAILPMVAEQTQNRLIRSRPDLHKEIGEAVEGVATQLVDRRDDLDNDVARVWAKAFTEEELRQLSAFYKSPAGAKLAEIGPEVLSSSFGVAKNWSDRVAEEMLEKARAQLTSQGH